MIRFDGEVALVTGAGAGLGAAYAKALATRGAHVVVCDAGVDLSGAGPGGEAAARVVADIVAAGGSASAMSCDVTDEVAVAAMLDDIAERRGRLDVVINNAGILRDRSFAKMLQADFRAVVAVHLDGSAIITRAAWPLLVASGAGRVVLTSSASGLYGNFGQANYASAKAAMIGLMNVLAAEGERHGIRVNTLAPTATTRMTEALIPEVAAALLTPDSIVPGLLWLASAEAPNRLILAAGAGCFAKVHITETPGIILADDDLTPEAVAANAAAITDPEGAEPVATAFDQSRRFAERAAHARGLTVEWPGGTRS